MSSNISEPNRKWSEWIKTHKTKLIIAGLGIVAMGLLTCYGDRRFVGSAGMNEMFITPNKPQMPIKTVKTTRSPASAPFTVNAHIRKLPEGYHASPEKLMWANNNGIELLPGHTVVEQYIKGTLAA